MSEKPGGCYVYLMRTCEREDTDGNALFKVGISRDASARLRQVQTGSAVEVGIAELFWFPERSMARDLETAFHKNFRHSAMTGEWFRMDHIVAADFLHLNAFDLWFTKQRHPVSELEARTWMSGCGVAPRIRDRIIALRVAP